MASSRDAIFCPYSGPVPPPENTRVGKMTTTTA